MIVELFLPLYFASVAILLVVLRAGASRVFFDVVGTFQAERLIADARAKVGVFEGLMLDGITGITESAGLLDDQLQSVVDSTVPLARTIAEARLEFEKFANVGEEETAKMVADMSAFGESIGFTADQALNAGSRMAQLGGVLGTGSIGAASEVGITFGLIGGMETQEAMTKLINLQQQTQFMMGSLTEEQFRALNAEKQANMVRHTSMNLLDSLNTIENRSSATMQGITHVMNEFAAAGNLAGDSINFMASASAVLIERGEQQGKAGRALKQMYARLGADTGGVATELERLGIETQTASGEMRSMEDIMGDLTKSSVMNSQSEKRRIAQLLAGNDHYIRAIKLMEGYDRAMELTSQSINDVDSAQEELNRKLEDEATLLKIAEARLDNMNAKLGNALIPAVTRGTLAQANFNSAVADLINTDIGKPVSELVFGMQQYMKVFAPFGEAYLNILSMNVSLRTQETIMRGLAGVDIARASAYGMKSGQESATLQNLRQELNLQDQISLQKIGQLQTEQMKLTSMKQMQMAADISHLKDLASLDLEEAKIMERYNKEKSLINEISLLNKLTTQDEFQRLKTSEQALVPLRSRLTLDEQLRMIARETTGYRMADVDVATREERLMKNKLFLKNSEKLAQQNLNADLVKAEQHERVLLSLGHIRNIQDEHGVFISNSKEGAYLLERLNQELVMTGHVEEINAIRMKKVELLQYILQVMQGGKLTGQAHNMEIMLLDAAALATERLDQEGRQKLNTQQVSNIVSEEASRVALKLSTMLGIESDVLHQIIMQLPIFANEINAANMAQDALAAKSMRNSQRLMMLNGSLGIVSMSLSFFSSMTEDAELQQDLMTASVIAMGASMVISTVQMGVMGAQMADTATKTMGLAGAQGALNTQMATGNASMLTRIGMFGGVGLAIAGISYTLLKIIPESMEASESIDEVSDSLERLQYAVTDFTQEEFNAMGMKFQDMDYMTTQNEIMNMNSRIALQQQQSDKSENERVKAMHQQKIDNMLKEQSILDQLSLTKFVQDVEGGDMSSGYLRSLENLFDDKDILGDTFEERLGTQFFDPSSLIYDLALTSNSMENFMALVKNMGRDFEMGDMQGAIDTTFIGPLEAARDAMYQFGNEREEMFFGMKAGNVTGDMLKQVVNKGVETLINTTELIMNNTFNGMTTRQAANEITKMVEDSLAEKGVNLTE